MNVRVNSQQLELLDDQRLLALMKKLSLDSKSGIAVAVNAEVIPQKNWNEFLLSENDEIIIIEAAQGG